MVPAAPSSRPAGMGSPPCSAGQTTRSQQPLPAQRALTGFDWPDGLALTCAHGPPHRRGSRARRELLRARGEPSGAGDGRRQRIPDPAQRVHPRGRRRTSSVRRRRSSISGCRSSATWSSRCASTDWRTRRSRATGDRRGRAACAPATCRPLPGCCSAGPLDVETLIDDLARARVVTLTGVGGIGKTRLALEVGRRLQPTRRDGVWFAALDTVDRPDAMVPSAARPARHRARGRAMTWTP